MLKLRSLVSQLCAIFPYTCLQFTLGSFAGFHTILIAELYSKNSEIPTSFEQLSWFASLDIVKSVGTLFTGLLMHHFGCRLLVLTSTMTFIVSCLLYYYSTTATIITTSRILNSFLATKAMSNPYISEVSEPQYRGTFLAISGLADNVGMFFSLLLGSLMYWRTIALVNLTFPIVAAVTVLLTPNSPSWLANKGRLEETKKALCWLRGWVQPDQVNDEFLTLINSVKQSSSTSNESDVETNSWKYRLRHFFQNFARRSFYVPLGTICILYFLYSFSGMDTTEAYATVIFHELNSPIEESIATAIMGAMVVIGSLVVMILIRRTGRRKLVFYSVIVSGLCQATVASIGFLNFKGQYLWIPPIAVIVAKFANASGVGAIVFMLPSELFSSSVRYIGTSITISVKMIFRPLVDKMFLYAVEAVTLPGVFLFFAIINLIALFVYYYLFPETEGKSLREIEGHFKSIEDTSEREKKTPKVFLS